MTCSFIGEKTDIQSSKLSLLFSGKCLHLCTFLPPSYTNKAELLVAYINL